MAEDSNLLYNYYNQKGYQYQSDDSYSFSEDYNQQLKDNNLTDVVSNDGFDENSMHTEDERQILIFIRNYDKNGNITESPKNAITTYIDTYERVMEHVYYKEKYQEDGATKEKITDEYIIKEDPYIFIDDSIKVVEPHVIPETRFLKNFLIEYFKSYPETHSDKSKTLIVEFHNTTDSYHFYDAFDKETIDLIKLHNYKNISLSLDNREFKIEDSFVFSFDSFKLSNAILYINSKSDITIKSNSVVFDTVEVDVECTRLPTINLQVKNTVELKYITFTKKLAMFNIHGDQDEIFSWMNTKVSIFNFNYDSSEYSYDEKLNSIITIQSFYNVTITGLVMNVNKFNITALRLINVVDVIMNTCNFHNYGNFEKSVISIESITSLSACSVYASQDKVQKEKLFFFIITKGDTKSNYNFIHCITKRIGVLSLIEDFASKVSISSSQSLECSHPYSYMRSSVGKIVISKSNFSGTKSLELAPNNLSFFDTAIESDELDLSSTGKIYISNTSIKLNTGKFTLAESCSVLFENSTIRAKDFSVLGNYGSGIFKINSTKVYANSFNIASVNKFSTENSNFMVKNISLKCANINSFNPNFMENKIESIEMQGKITNSNLFITNKFAKSLKLILTNTLGNLSVNYLDYIPRAKLELENSVLNLRFNSLNSNVESNKLDLTCKDCTGSIIYSTTDKIEYVPKTEGSFADLKYFTKDIPLDDVKRKSEYKEKIAYGYQ